MGIKFSVGVSDGHEDRRLLDELRRKSPAGQRAGEKKREAKASGWQLKFAVEDDPSPEGQSLWAW